jgi:hypothetical protein
MQRQFLSLLKIFKSNYLFAIIILVIIFVFNTSLYAFSANCTDNDGDRHIVENNSDFASCGNVCGPSKNQSCQGYNDCNDNNPKIYYGALNICNSGVDESCGKYANTCFCTDGTEKNKCAPNPPWQCSSEGILAENCKVCGCQNLWVCGPIGTYCLPLKPVCGNNICESELGESCSDCAKDCGRCPASLTPGSHTITLMVMDPEAIWPGIRSN